MPDSARPGRCLGAVRGGVLGLLLLLVFPALAAEPPAQPFLRIEAGGHIGAVAHLSVDASGRLMASASYDKTVRLWSMPDGAQRAVLRPPIGLLSVGEIDAVALTPDGHYVFAAGATGQEADASFAIYRFDVEARAPMAVLPNIPARIFDLAVSPDGTRLAAGLAQGGIIVWDTAGKFIFADPAYRGAVRSVIFDRDGRLYTASADGRVRVYDPSGRPIANAAPPSGVRPWGLALSPDGALLAITGETADKAGKLRLDVVSARTLASVFTPDTTNLQGGGLLSAAWVSDARGGVQLLAGGYATGGGGYVIRRWSDFGLGGFSDIAAAHDTIRHIVALPGGGAVYATEDPGWGRMGADGRILRRPAPPLADLRPAREQRIAASADGSVIEFSTASGLQHFAVRDRKLSVVTTPDAALAVPRLQAAGLALADWRDTSAPRLNGQRLALDPTEISRSYAILPDGSGVLVGTDTHLRLFGRDGREVAAVDTPAEVHAVTVAASGKVAVAALLDGTLRWYGLDAGGLRERAALFAHSDGLRWVLFTPEGFFDHADRGGNELVGVHLNNGRARLPDWVSFSQAYRVLYAPAIVRAGLMGEKSAAQARLAELGDIRARLARQPIVEVRAACVPQQDRSCQPVVFKPGTPVSLPADAASIQLTAVVTERGLGVGPLDLFINDRNVGRTLVPAVNRTVVLNAPLDPGTNTVELRVYDGAATVFTQASALVLTREGTVSSSERGRLFVLAVGIDHYANSTLTLHYAVADARTFTDTIRAAAAPLFRSVEVTQLLDAQATKAGITAAFNRLAKDVRPGDTFLFYVASHGLLDETTDRFLLVPQDMSDISSWQTMARQSIDEGTLVGLLSRIEARDALLFLDTCHSGLVTADSLANVGHETGRYLLTASSSVQEALDSYDDRNGVFVYAVREALAGRAGEDADGNLGALSLGEYVSRRVGQLAREKHHEQDAVFRTAQRDLRSFPVARVRH